VFNPSNENPFLKIRCLIIIFKIFRKRTKFLRIIWFCSHLFMSLF